MIKRGIENLLKNKKADSPVYPTVIFITLNIMFVVLLLMFIWKSSSGALIYEQTYAKQIALLIDSAEPGMKLSINVEKGFEIAEKNDFDKEKIVKIEGNEIIVKLASKGGYSFQFFSDYDIETKMDLKNNLLILEIKDRGENE